MKLAIITADLRDTLHDYASATPRFSASTAALLQGFAMIAEMEVHVIACTQKPMKSPEKLAENISFHSVYVPAMGWLRDSYQGCIRMVRRQLKAIKPDLVHGFGTERECAVCAAFSRFPNVITVHQCLAEMARQLNPAMGSADWLAAQLETPTLKRTLGVFCPSEAIENLVKPLVAKTWVVPDLPDISNDIKGAELSETSARRHLEIYREVLSNAS